jgi:thiazole/oxazole-forming peptide maturase SagC family component
VSWLPASIDGPYLFIGPTIHPHGAPCYDCFEQRTLMNLKYKENYLNYKKAIAQGNVLLPNMPLHKVISHMVASYAAQEILNYTLMGTTFTQRKVLSIYIPTMEFKYNEVQPLASCDTCGSVHHRDNQQLYFDVHALLQSE